MIPLARWSVKGGASLAGAGRGKAHAPGESGRPRGDPAAKLASALAQEAVAAGHDPSLPPERRFGALDRPDSLGFGSRHEALIDHFGR